MQAFSRPLWGREKPGKPPLTEEHPRRHDPRMGAQTARPGGEVKKRDEDPLSPCPRMRDAPPR